MNDSIQLKGITWDHTRGYVPMVATAQRFHELHPNVEISWEKRSLQEFADEPLAGLAARYDLLVIDHPWAGFASSSGILLPLEKHLPAEFLADQAANPVGKSHVSYQFNGSQWALAMDAACPVSAYRPDLLEKAGVSLPETFDDLIALGKRGLVCCPSIPLDVYGNFLNMLTAAGEKLFPNHQQVADKDAALVALERLKQLADVVPHEFFKLNPIRTMEVMSQQNRFAYCPYTYGYSNYSRPGYAPHLLKCGDVIGIEKGKPGSTMLGGTGLAISSACKHTDVAVEYAELVGDPATQRGIAFQSGGQPGHRSAWLDTGINAASSNFFHDTLPTLDRAFIRPQHDGYLFFQDKVGIHIQNYLRSGGDTSTLLETINKMYRESFR